MSVEPDGRRLESGRRRRADRGRPAHHGPTWAGLGVEWRPCMYVCILRSVYRLLCAAVCTPVMFYFGCTARSADCCALYVRHLAELSGGQKWRGGSDGGRIQGRMVDRRGGWRGSCCAETSKRSYIALYFTIAVEDNIPYGRLGSVRWQRSCE